MTGMLELSGLQTILKLWLILKVIDDKGSDGGKGTLEVFRKGIYYLE